MKSVLINAGVYLYRDHYIVKRRDCRAWNVFPCDDEGITLHKAKSRANCEQQIDSFSKAKKKVQTLF